MVVAPFAQTVIVTPGYAPPLYGGYGGYGYGGGGMFMPSVFSPVRTHLATLEKL